MKYVYIKMYQKDDNWNVVNSKSAWGIEKCKKKYKTIKLKVEKEKYDKVMELVDKFLKENEIKNLEMNKSWPIDNAYYNK